MANGASSQCDQLRSLCRLEEVSIGRSERIVAVADMAPHCEHVAETIQFPTLITSCVARRIVEREQSRLNSLKELHILVSAPSTVIPKSNVPYGDWIEAWQMRNAD